MYPVDDEPTKTSNRALFNVNNRYYIDPMCEEHDTEDDRVEKAPNAYYPEFLCQDCADQEEVEEKQDENRSLGEF
jgi:hypothetical protein